MIVSASRRTDIPLYVTITPDDVVKDRAMESCKVQQLNLF